MTTLEVSTDPPALRRGDWRFSISPETGTLLAIERPDDGTRHRLQPIDRPPIQWTVGGTERRDPPSAEREYEDAETYGTGTVLANVESVRTESGVHLDTLVECGDWQLEQSYTLESETPGIQWSFELTYRGSNEEVRLRSISVPLQVPVESPDTTLDVPGGPLPPSSPIPELDPGRVLDWGIRRYHAGLTGVEGTDEGVALWAFSETFPTALAIDAEAGSDSLTATYRFQAAARLSPGDSVSIDGLAAAGFTGEWDDWLADFDRWWESIGIRTPDDRSAWFEGARIYEAHVGAAQFPDGFAYEPYDSISALVDDLPRIAALGFDTLQLMPRHPVPSYTAPIGASSDTAWGPRDALDRLVSVAHALDVRVVLDVVLHGVLDRDVLDRTLESIDERSADPTADPLAAYVHSHAPEWRDHLPDRHPLIDEHPEWFVKTDDGDVAHRYTHALDIANPDVQDFFIDRLTSLSSSLEVDGFRIDAPTWNAFPNWDTGLSYPAGHAPFGARAFLERARSAVSEIVLYVEAASPIFRTASDANYSYDELWLFEAVFGANTTRMGREPASPIDAEDLALWMRRRDAALPAGSRTAHQLDSHDTFWWPDPGEKWFRERYGLDRTKAMVALVSMLPGPFMTYGGGEQEIEDWLERLLAIRGTYEELEIGECRYPTDLFEDAAIFAAVRRLDEQRSLVAVNISDRDVSASLDAGALIDSPATVIVDPLRRVVVGTAVDQSDCLDLSFDAFEPRILVCR